MAPTMRLTCFLLAALPCMLVASPRRVTGKEIECRRATGKITLDGKLDEADWKNAALVPEFSTGGGPARSKTRAKLLWDDEYLYLAAEMDDVDLYGDVKQRNGMTWSNDVIELFLKPSETSTIYYEFQVNPLNTPLELLFPSRGAGGFNRFAPVTRLGMQSVVHLEGTLNHWEDDDKGWTVEMRIPWSAFTKTTGKPKPGDKWRFSCCRYDYSKAYDSPDVSSSAGLRGSFHGWETYDFLIFKP